MALQCPLIGTSISGKINWPNTLSPTVLLIHNMNQELNPKNFRRISIINWLLSFPFFLLFSWPYLYIANFMDIERVISYIGCIFFSIPFMITILHGHVTMALGEAHRHHYYDWLDEHPLTYGLLFHPIMTRTRFRLILLVVSILLLIGGLLLQIS